MENKPKNNQRNQKSYGRRKNNYNFGCLHRRKRKFITHGLSSPYKVYCKRCGRFLYTKYGRRKSKQPK